MNDSILTLVTFIPAIGAVLLMLMPTPSLGMNSETVSVSIMSQLV